jgi:hypothetical protein
MKFEIEFRPASEEPKQGSGQSLQAALILNPCDGYHQVWARWDSTDGEFIGFIDWASSSWERYEPGREFIGWALLPDDHALIEGMRALCG